MKPSYGSRGLFKFAEPFNSVLPDNHIYEVISIRSIRELSISGEDPLNSIYKTMGMSESEYDLDVSNNVSIVVFSNDGGEVFFVPDTKVLSEAMQSGIKYSQKTLMVNLGFIPETLYLDLMKSSVRDIIYDTLGLATEIVIEKTSTTVLVSEVENNNFMLKTNTNKTINKSSLTRYEELMVLYDEQRKLISNIENVYRQNKLSPR